MSAGQKKEIFIQAYSSYITADFLYLKGRLLKDTPLIDKPKQGVFRSLMYTVIRSLSREVKTHPVSYTYNSIRKEIFTDKEGYFEVFDEIDTQGETTVRIDLNYKGAPQRKVVELEKYTHREGTGIISDIDDTLMVTGVKSFLKSKVVFYTLFRNPFRRQPIKDASMAFNSLAQSIAKNGPIIYLSNSPWNLYTYLTSFLTFNNFPHGILILRDFGLQLIRKSKVLSDGNKYKEIQRILRAFPNFKFVLVGDSGELDYDIYQAIDQQFPDRISKIILNRAGNSSKERQILAKSKMDSKYKLVDGYSDLIELTLSLH